MKKVEKIGFGILGSHIMGRVIGLITLGLFIYFLGAAIICWALPFSFEIEGFIVIIPLFMSTILLKIFLDKMQKPSRRQS